MKKSTKYAILLAILLLAGFLRLWRLGEFPALNADEAAIGYNVYSLIETGKDEHGNPWPIHFQSFNDFKPGGYFYLAFPFVKFMGLNELSVRLPGALFGIASVLALYFLVKELFDKENLALVSSFFLAISPWHIHFSRGAWEVNVATFFIILGVYLFVKGAKKGSKIILSLSFVSFALSLYTYHAARVVVPLLGAGLLVIYRKSFKENFKNYLVAAFVGFVVLAPLAKDVVNNNVLSRAAGVGLFADKGPISRINEQRGQHKDFRGMPAIVFHNKAVNFGLAFLENWAEHYWGEFLFLTGDEIQRNRVPETGQMYLFDIILVIAGFYFIAKKPKGWEPILVWLVFAPVAAALTFQSPHALRAQNIIVPLVVVSAWGFIKLLESFSGYKKVLIPVFALAIAWNFALYLHNYWVHMAKEYPFSSQYGMEEVVDYVEKEGDKFESVVVTDRYDQPYILFLFYLKYPPERFQVGHALSPRDEFGFSTVRSFDKYRFFNIDFDTVKNDYKGSLIIGTEEEIPHGQNVVNTVYFPNKDVAFRIVAN